MGAWLLLILIALAVCAITLKLLWRRIDWSIHRDMTARKCEVYGDGTFEDFLKEFRKYEWRKRDDYSDSLFHPEVLNETNYLHAGIFKFNNTGMRMKTVKDYKKAMEWIKFYINEEKDVWDWALNENKKGVTIE